MKPVENVYNNSNEIENDRKNSINIENNKINKNDLILNNILSDSSSSILTNVSNTNINEKPISLHQIKKNEILNESYDIDEKVEEKLDLLSPRIESSNYNQKKQRRFSIYAMITWYKKLIKNFGLSFVLIVGTVYWIQGFKSFSTLAIGYLYKDIFHLEPTESQMYTTTMMIPWGIKPIYGILSDTIPLFGYHRRSYLFLFAIISCISYFLLSIKPMIPNASIATFFLFLTNLSTAFNDVVIDAKVVEMSRLDPMNGANDLQTLSWSMMSIGGAFGSILSGPATDIFGPHLIFFFSSICPFIIIILSYYMKDAYVGKNKMKVTRLKDHDNNNNNNNNNLIKHSNEYIKKVKLQLRLLLTSIRYPLIWKSALWIFLSGALTPGYGQISFYFITDILKFTPEFLGFISSIGYIILMIGTMLYNNYFKHIRFHKIFAYTQMALTIISLSDIIIFTRYNLKMGIPDKLFVLGDEIISDMIGRIQTMPMLVLCSKICPKGIEGTLFALFMSISNFSYSVSSYWGAFICNLLDIKKDHYSNLWIAVIIRSFFKLFPIFFLFLIPASDLVKEVENIEKNIVDVSDKSTVSISLDNHKNNNTDDKWSTPKPEQGQIESI